MGPSARYRKSTGQRPTPLRRHWEWDVGWDYGDLMGISRDMMGNRWDIYRNILISSDI